LIDRLRVNLGELESSACESASLYTAFGWEGGWYAVLRVPAIQSDEDLAVEAGAEVGVLVIRDISMIFPVKGHLVLSLIYRAGSVSAKD